MNINQHQQTFLSLNCFTCAVNKILGSAQEMVHIERQRKNINELYLLAVFSF